MLPIQRAGAVMNVVALLAFSAGCHAGDAAISEGADLGAAADLSPVTPPDLWWDHSLIANRPYQSQTPTGYDPQKPTPLVVALHGLGDTGANFATGFGLLDLSNQRGFLLAYPDGTATFQGGYWNANDVCCQLGNPVPDDVAYLDAVVSDMSEKFNVDKKRIYYIGLSNGGMMAHRMACESAWQIGAIVSVSGAQGTDHSLCMPNSAVNVLEVHGTADTTVPYNGGPTLGGIGPVVISAMETIQVWVDRNGCTGMDPNPPGPYDIDASLPGDETTAQRWIGCKAGGDTQLWTVAGGMHVPDLTPTAPGLFYDWLAARPKP